MTITSLKITPETYLIYLAIPNIVHVPLMNINRMHVILELGKVGYLEEREFHEFYKYVGEPSLTKPTTVERLPFKE